jgi:folate-binding protein YgfZ
MATVREIQEAALATFMHYGPPSGDAPPAEVVDTFGQYEAEYAAIRKGAAFIAAPHRGAIAVEGADRLDFLHKMLTHDTLSLQPGQGRRALLLGRTGRVIADLLVLEDGAATRLVTDQSDVAAVIRELNKYIVMEDVRLRPLDEAWQISVHGPLAASLIDQLTGASLGELAALAHRAVEVGQFRGSVYRFDQAGVPGLHLTVPREAASRVYESFMELARHDGWQPATDFDPSKPAPPTATGKTRTRPAGWLAFNTARIEAGSPLFHIDFGPDSLPAETGVLAETVSFTKGCYLGQEIVARMQNLGRPKRVLVGLRMNDERMPIAGAQVMEAGEAGGVIGAVTSSTISPMLGNIAIAFAVMKWGRHRPGEAVLVPAEGGRVPATVQSLVFLPASPAAAV